MLFIYLLKIVVFIPRYLTVVKAVQVVIPKTAPICLHHTVYNTIEVGSQ